jgi:hypothetical protein
MAADADSLARPEAGFDVRRWLAASILLCSCAATEAQHRKLGYTPVPGGSGGLTAIPDQTALANVSGVSAVPSATNVSQLQTMLGVQASNAVNITGGTISGVNNATTSTQGMMAPNDKAAVDGVLSWARTQIVLLNVQVPALTHFRVIPIGGTPIPTNVADAAILGGAWTANSGVIGTLYASSTSTPTSASWALVARCKFNNPISGRVSQVGLINGGGTHATVFGTIFAGDTTHFVLKIGAAATTYSASTQASDAAFHDFAMWMTSSTVHLWIDGVDSTASLATSLMTGGDEAVSPLIFNSTPSDAVIEYLLIAW